MTGQPLAPGQTIGILGGGQLGRMLAVAAARLGLAVHVFDPSPDAPAAHVAGRHTCAGFDDAAALDAFARACAVVTYEFENIPRHSLERLSGAVPLRPGIASLEVSQDRLDEKTYLAGLGLALAPFAAIDGPADLPDAHAALGGDTILKTRRLGYDGKGQVRLAGPSIDAQAAWQAVGSVPAVLEARIPFCAEVSAIIVRGSDAQSVAYDVPVNRHVDGILHTSAVGALAPQALSDTVIRRAQQDAIALADALDHVGVLTMEFFLTQGGDLLVNEFAPRVHNSGHWTMDACLHDQFDNHIRAVAGWPLADATRHSDALMTNLIGADVETLGDLRAQAGVKLHLYGKTQARKGRKMGHFTRIAPRGHQR